MKQQDFWTWADEEGGKRERASGGGGRLFLAELPTDLGLSLREIQKLHEELQSRMGSIDLVLTDNRRRMVSARRKRKRIRVRLHHMFVGAELECLDALATLISGEGDVPAAREELQNYINDHREEISYEIDPTRVETRGEHHDLQKMLEKWRRIMGPEKLSEVVITWGRRGKGSRTIRFGSYDFDRKLIRMHPSLDQAWVPDYFVEFIVYHELLHALFPPKKKGARRQVHTPEFRRMEEQFPRYEEAMRWERKNLSRFLER